MIAAVLFVTIAALAITMCIYVSQPSYELTLDGTTIGITSARGLDPMKSSISMDFKMKPLLNDRMIGLFCIGLREQDSPPSKKYLFSIGKSSFMIRILKQNPPVEKVFEQQLDRNLFDEQWHSIGVVIDVSTQKIFVNIDGRQQAPVVDDIGKYPIGDVDKAYIGGILGDSYTVNGQLKNVKFGNVAKTFRIVRRVV